MKFKKLIPITALALLGSSTIINTISPSQQIEAKTKKATQSFKKGTYKTKNATLKLQKVRTYKVQATGVSPQYSSVIQFKFTNNSKKNMKPRDFYWSHIRTFMSVKNSWSELIYPDNVLVFPPSKDIANLVAKSNNYVKPKKSLTCAVATNHSTIMPTGGQYMFKGYKNIYDNKTLGTFKLKATGIINAQDASYD